MKAYENMVQAIITSQDEAESRLGDTLDIKTSIVLLVVTFLANQSHQLLYGAATLPTFWKYAQTVSIILLIIAGGLALCELFPRHYALRMQPKQLVGWIMELEEFYRNDSSPEEGVLSEFRKREIERIQSRFDKNSKINTTKSFLLEWSFYFTLGVVVINLLTLLCVRLSLSPLS